MHVNSFYSIFRSSRLKLFAGGVIVLCTIFFLAAAFAIGSPEGISKRVNLAVRAIGHNLLLQAGDSTSLVRPVIEKSNGVFLLEFENEFSFQPDTLVSIVQRSLNKTELPQYIVTVHECDRSHMVYGFEISSPGNIDIACIGRRQPKACYTIEIAFANFPEASVPYTPIAIIVSSMLSLFALVLIGENLWSKNAKPPLAQNTSIQNDSGDIPTIGKFIFYTSHQYLRLGQEIISLTDKECKILSLLHRNIGSLTLRDELIQEVWTDEGVITGRSLDMFISKLRKKLAADPDLRITNIHGKGYKLEIVNRAAFDLD